VVIFGGKRLGGTGKEGQREENLFFHVVR
jgi:hypothetical protein